jgi:predicted MFS family arabinose efflux permease
MGWRGAFAALAGAGLLVTFAVAGVLCPRPAALRQRLSIRETLTQYQPLLRHTSTLSTIAATVLGNASTWAIWTYVAAFLVQRYEVSTLELGLTYLVVGVAVLLGTLLAGGRVGRQPRRLLIAGRAGCGLLLGAALLLSVPVLIAVAALAAALLLHAASGLASVNLLSDEAPTGRATSLALNGSALSLGVALGGALGGVGLELGGYSMLGLLGMMLGLSAAGVVWCFRPSAGARLDVTAPS